MSEAEGVLAEEQSKAGRNTVQDQAEEDELFQTFFLLLEFLFHVLAIEDIPFAASLGHPAGQGLDRAPCRRVRLVFVLELGGNGPLDLPEQALLGLERFHDAFFQDSIKDRV